MDLYDCCTLLKHVKVLPVFKSSVRRSPSLLVIAPWVLAEDMRLVTEMKGVTVHDTEGNRSFLSIWPAPSSQEGKKGLS